MHNAVHEQLQGIDLFIGVAAVADYRVAQAAEQKIKKRHQMIRIWICVWSKIQTLSKVS